MMKSEINTEKYGAHSVRAAATSKAKLLAVPISEIIEKEGWSKSSTFARYYDKEIIGKDKVADAVLKL
ncbi:hypothetical protein DPMN_101191 [Dreissena polymorpha]|uniref:Tyr recombinase domain-containing protein n=1 Tax=Dreissena polymorpha TaxID=45954 RepID=A0A9D4LH87_DREPO|nr:hypothetical protein DPMN_101191 [Dreissena polymorpha]